MAGFGYQDTSEALYALLGEDWQYDQVGHMYLSTFYDRAIDGDHRASVLEGLQDWMEHEYDLDFENWLDWDEFRAWYDGG